MRSLRRRVWGWGLECVLQSGNMTEGEKEAFLERFEGESDGTLVGFCVMGGIFSDGDRSDRGEA